ncbi:TPA: Cro/CI family transcriptional regulator [Serratia marcescens]
MLKEKVVSHFGSIIAVAERLGISHSAVSQWGKVIPEKNALRLHQITNGELKYEESLYRNSDQLNVQ